MRIHFALYAILTGFVTSALCQSPAPSTIAAFAEPALVGMKLSIARAVKAGKASEVRGQCVAALTPSAFSDVVDQLLSQYVTPSELQVAESFFASKVGKKYVQHGTLQIYQQVGMPLPASLPEFSDAEYKQLESFAATKVGDALIKQKVMESASSRQVYQGRIGALLSQCPN
ncbi:MAG: hypothetical protein CFE41_20455 [Burkholderiales bacterium PBB2]|nr:MAG: hypothetical protein CFE41_20455 [Burkholderiales bacterium PBB2]